MAEHLQLSEPLEEGSERPADVTERRVQPVPPRFALRALLAAVLGALATGLASSARPDPAEAANGVFSSNSTLTPAVLATGTNGAIGVEASSDTGAGVSATGY